MTIDPPFHIYREQLSSLYHGVGLWKPNPEGLYDKASIGDVGYVSDGAFIRMFNVRLPWDHQSNSKLGGEPHRYDPLSFSNLTIRRETFDKVDYYSRSVSRDENSNNVLAAIPEPAEGVTYRCHGRGALVSLPHGGYRKDAINTKVFEKYIRDNVVGWFDWAQSNQLGVEHLEDIILVSGCTLTTSWAVATFVDTTMDAEISLASRPLNNGGASFVWYNIRGPVTYHNSRHNPNLPAALDQCVFIKGFRAKRILFWTKPIRAAAGPLPDDPENRREDEVEVTQAPWVPNYDDPLIGILDYIAEECHEDAIAEDTMAVVHDDNLRLVEKVETLTADAVLKYLRENKIPVFVENGAAVALCPHGHVSEHEKTENSPSKGANITDKPDNDMFGILSHTSLPHNRPIFSVGDTSIRTIPSPIFPRAAGRILPPLPKIESGGIQKGTLAHSSLAAENRYDFWRPVSDPSVDNEELGQIGDQVFASAVTDPTQDGVSMDAPLNHSRVDTGVHRPSEFSAFSTLPGNNCPPATVQHLEGRTSTEMSQQSQNLGECPIAASSRSPLQPEGRQASGFHLSPHSTLLKAAQSKAARFKAVMGSCLNTVLPRSKLGTHRKGDPSGSIPLPDESAGKHLPGEVNGKHTPVDVNSKHVSDDAHNKRVPAEAHNKHPPNDVHDGTDNAPRRQSGYVTPGSSRSNSTSSLYPGVHDTPFVLSLSPSPPRSKTSDDLPRKSPAPQNKAAWQTDVSASTSGSSTYGPEPPPPRSQARPPSFHMHPLFSYTRLHQAPISYDIASTPSARTVVDRTLHSPFPAVTLAQPATEPPIPASSRLILRSPKLPWVVVVGPISSPSTFVIGKDGQKHKAKSPAALTNLDVLYAVHSTLMTRVTHEEWDSLGEDSRTQRRVADAYETRCTRMGGDWEGGVRRVDWLGSKTHLVGIEIDKSNESGENVGKLVFG